MSKVVTILKCESCGQQGVKMTVKDVKSGIDIKVTNCKTCKRSYGVFGVQKLEVVQTIKS